MAKYVLLPDVNELARAVSDPEVRRLVMEAFDAIREREGKPPAEGQEHPAKHEESAKENGRRPKPSK